MASPTDEEAARERAEQHYDEAAARFRAGELTPPELEGAAGRIEDLGRTTDDETARVEIGALADSLRELPELVQEEGAFGAPPLNSTLVDKAKLLAAWGWEELPSTGARIERVKQAIERIDRLPRGDVEEEHAVRTQRAQLEELLSALEANRT
jgi:hypothetical protein